MSTRTTALLAFFVAGCATEFGISDVKDPIPDPPSTRPIATCQAAPNPVTPPFEAASWLGTGTDDSGAAIIEYRWELIEAPEGSAVTMPPGDAERHGFTPDQAGQYTASLVVVNEYGDESEPCLAVLDAVPAQNLWIEMFWSEPQDDMDLHLIRQGGRPESDDDCYFANCTPDSFGLNWGGNGASDDPVLDLDDIPGTGPENINIDQPADEVFVVMVHDYEHGFFGTVEDYPGPNQVTVNVYIDGALAFTDTKAISGENQRVGFAVIDWAAGTVEPY
jgi:hypothetical protein